MLKLTINPVWLIVITISLLFAISADAAIGWKYLTIPQGAREIAMGETGVSHSVSASSVWWNPAHFASGTAESWFQGNSWIDDATGSYGGNNAKTRWGGFGVWYTHLGMDGFEVRDHPGESQGEFTMRQSVIALGAGFNLSKDIKAGISYKNALETIYGSRQYLRNVFDAGAKWQLNQWAMGVALRNLSISAERTGYYLPALAQFGGSYQHDLGLLKLNSAADLILQNGDEQYLHLGAELDYDGIGFVRGGYMFGHDTRSVTFGMGVTQGRFRLDYALVPFSNSLGSTSRLGISVRLI